MRAPESHFERYMSERNLSFAYLKCPSGFRAQSAIKTFLRFAIFNFSDKLQNIFEIGLKKYRVFVQKSISLKKYFKRKNRRHVFVVYVLINLPNVKILGQWDKFPMIFSFLRCPL